MRFRTLRRLDITYLVRMLTLLGLKLSSPTLTVGNTGSEKRYLAFECAMTLLSLIVRPRLDC